MIAFTTLALLVIAFLGSTRVGVKGDRLLSFFVFILLSAVFMQFYLAMHDGIEETFSFLWNSSPSGDIKIDIISNIYHYNLILPFFVTTLLACANNLIFRYEERRGIYSAILVFNLAALILMVTSNNFVQLLCALFVIDILSMFLIKDFQACRRYLLLNMVADMLVFTVLAIINCRVDSLDIREILRYRQIGLHLDFIAIAGLTAVFIKMGFWGFHVGMVGLKSIRFHRLLNVLFLSSPIGAVILLMKFHVLWNTSEYFAPYLHSVCLLSIAGGFFGSLLMNELKHKIIYWQMMFWAIFVELLCFKGFVWSAENGYLLLQMLVLMWGLYLLYYYSRRQKSMLLLVKQKFEQHNLFAIIFILITLMIAAMAGTFTAVYNRGNRYYIWFFAVAFVLSLATILCQIFYTPRKAVTIKKFYNQPHIISFFLLTIIGVFVLQPQYLNTLPVYGFTMAFVLLCRWSPLQKLQFVYKNSLVQDNDLIGNIYKYTLVKPLRLCGKFLWLLIDHLFIERIVIGFFLSAAQSGLRFFRQLHNNTTLGGTIIVLLLGAMLWFSYMWGGK